ncbi:hypothetical protein D3C80_1305340 [compost metagenome]
MDVVDVGQQAVDRFAHVRVEVDRVDDVHIRELTRGLHQSLADALEAAPEVFAAVAGDQHHAALGVQEAELVFELAFQRGAFQLADHFQQRVDHGVAGGVDGRGVGTFTQQVVLRGGGWREVQGGQRAGQAAVAFFRPWRIQVASAQAGFHVGNRNLLVVGGQAGGQGCCGVAVHQHHVGLELGQHRLQALQNRRGHIGQVLAGLHDVQVVVGRDLEQFQNLVKHLAVLASYADARLETVVLGKVEGQRGHFDGFWAGAKYG